MGGDIDVKGNSLKFTNSYIKYGSSAMEFYYTNKGMSITSTGGTMHGVWTSEVVMTSSDRRLKTSIAPLYKALQSRMPEEGNAQTQQEISQSSPDASQERAGDFLGATKAEGKRKIHTTKSKTVNWVLRELRPVSFEFKSGPESKYARYGFVAQELERVLPNIVRDNDQYKYVIYQDLIAVLVLAAQAQEDKIGAQEDKIGALERQFEKVNQVMMLLAQRLEQLEVRRTHESRLRRSASDYPMPSASEYPMPGHGAADEPMWR
jgi:phage shock protein A